MAVFSVTALDRLIDSDRKSSSSSSAAGSGPGATSKSLQPGLQKQSSGGDGGGGDGDGGRGRGFRQRRPLFSYVSYPSTSTTPAAESATPQPQAPPLRPRSPSPTSFSPSPYVVNHKRRVPNGVDSKRTSQQNGFHVSQRSSVTRPSKSQELTPKTGKEEQREEVEEKVDFRRNLQNRFSDEGGSSTDVANNNDGQRAVLWSEQHGKSPQSDLTLQFQTEKVHGGNNADARSLPGGEKLDVMFPHGGVARAEEMGEGMRIGAGEEGRGMMSSRNVDPRGKEKFEEKSENGGSSNTISREGNFERIAQILDGSRNGPRTTSSSSSEEWFDAPDGLPPDYLSDDDSRRVALTDPGPSSRGDPDSNDFHQLKAEIQKRIAAEEAREEFRRQRDGMAQMLSSAGISVPQWGLGNVGMEIAQPSDDNAVGFSDSGFQRLTVARYVAGAVATGVVRAEAEAELQTVLAEKSREIARLKDKLQYYEVVNHEMSQRNQESIENARQTRRRRQRRQRLVLLGISAAIFVGVSVAVVYKYVPWDYVKDLRSGSSSSELPEGDQPDYSSTLEQVIDSVESTEPEN